MRIKKRKQLNDNNGYHSKSIDDVISILSTTSHGLTKDESINRLNKYGPNELPEKKKVHPIIMFLKQFKSVLIYILLIAAGISYVFDHVIDTFVIIGVILVNASMGFVQEFKAEKSIQALKQLVQPYAKVIRSGELLKISAKELVKGDLIVLEEGDRVPADARLIECKNLRTIDSSLTGESFPVSKEIKTLPLKTVLHDKINMVWMGTFVASGYAKALITDTGSSTIIGQIASSIEEIGDVDEHFQIKVDSLAKHMALIAIIGASITLLVGYLRQIEIIELLLFSIASLVSGIPEGLPAVLVVVLSIGAARMARKKAIIRKLASTETLGIVTTIITDKTGTLTKNTMNIESVILPGFGEVSVTGNGWEPTGEFSHEGEAFSPLENKQFAKLLHISGICNNAKLISEEGSHKIIGDPTEGALVVLVEKAGLRKDVIEQADKRIDDLPFNSNEKFRASLVQLSDGKKQIYAVGAPEVIIGKAGSALFNDKTIILTKKKKEELNKMVDKLTSRAMRVLCIAYRDTDASEIKSQLVDNLTIVGFVGMIDPLRPEVPDAVMRARKAGVRVMMSTGDHKSTALAIAKQAGIITDNDPCEAMTETELNELDEQGFSKAVSSINVFARVTPEIKLKIAEALQKKGEVIAMTGDGVNDAPALKKADIGVAMGIMGTDVAKEASEMVLADDNFSTIVNAIEEGRIVFDNTRKTSYYLITTNFAEDLTIVTTMLLGMPLPLLPTQILWLNLVTDGVNDIALATEPGHGEVLEEKPKTTKENIISRNIIPHLLIMSSVMAILVLLFFNNYFNYDLDKARTIAFSVMTFSQLWRVMSLRSLKKSIFKIGFFTNKYINASLIASVSLYFTAVYNPFLQSIFRFVPLGLLEIALVISLTSLVLWLSELSQYIMNHKLNIKLHH